MAPKIKQRQGKVAAKAKSAMKSTAKGSKTQPKGNAKICRTRCKKAAAPVKKPVVKAEQKIASPSKPSTQEEEQFQDDDRCHLCQKEGQGPLVEKFGMLLHKQCVNACRVSIRYMGSTAAFRKLMKDDVDTWRKETVQLVRGDSKPRDSAARAVTKAKYSDKFREKAEQEGHIVDLSSGQQKTLLLKRKI